MSEQDGRQTGRPMLPDKWTDTGRPGMEVFGVFALLVMVGGYAVTDAITRPDTGGYREMGYLFFALTAIALVAVVYSSIIGPRIPRLTSPLVTLVFTSAIGGTMFTVSTVTEWWVVVAAAFYALYAIPSIMLSAPKAKSAVSGAVAAFALVATTFTGAVVIGTSAGGAEYAIVDAGEFYPRQPWAVAYIVFAVMSAVAAIILFRDQNPDEDEGGESAIAGGLSLSRNKALAGPLNQTARERQDQKVIQVGDEDEQPAG